MIRPRFNPRVENLEDRLAPATITVSSAANSGAGTLREAITQANSAAFPGADVIQFNIPGTGVRKISLKSALPQITEQLTIDATTQPGFATTPVVTLNGAATTNAKGLIVAAAANNSIIRGLTIQAFDSHGVVLESDGNTVDTCFIGTSPLGTAAARNGGSGVAILNDSANNTIGGAGTAMNLISGNGQHGVLLKGAGVTGNDVSGVFVGTNLAGDIALPNGINGVFITGGATGNTIGDTTDPLNIVTFIAGNNGQGIRISGAGTSGNTVIHTTVGSNRGNGIQINGAASNNTIGGSVDGEFNVISSNLGSGVSIGGVGTTGNTVLGNLIGTDQDGLVDLGNSKHGVSIGGKASGNTIGGTAPFEGNVISGNGIHGVSIAGAGTSGNTVAGNIIGADATGTVDLGNTKNGVAITGSATGNTIGGTTTDALNLISGNNFHGIALAGTGTTGNAVIGNSIGTNLAGTASLANGKDGVSVGKGANNNTIGGSAAGEGNTISGNGRVGVAVQANQTAIQGNQIGTAADGTSPLANGSHGIIVTNKAANTLIGGVAAGEGNVIAHNGRNGVLIGRDATFKTIAGNGNAVLGNSIFTNSLLGIAVSVGANRNQKAPVINTATIITAGTQLQVNFQLTSRPNTTFRIEIFASLAADPLGFGEGQTFLGFMDVTTNAAGTATGTATVNYSAAFGAAITATATNLALNDSSPFSASVTAV